jgi:hypothetical protein
MAARKYIHLPTPTLPLLSLVDLDHQFLSCTHNVPDIAKPTQTHRNVQVGNRLHQNLFYACLAGDGEAVHERPTDWNGAVSENLGQKKKVRGENVPSTAWAPSASALRISLPVRMPESKRTVNFPVLCASRTLDDCITISSASSAPMDPSTWRPPDQPFSSKCTEDIHPAGYSP